MKNKIIFAAFAGSFRAIVRCSATLLCLATAHAQLAITEIVSSASTNLGPTRVTQNSDFWELTNFGTNSIPLTGYRFDDDSNDLLIADSSPFEGLVIGPNESILFVQSDTVTNREQFLEWWGPGINANVQVAFYFGNGFGAGGDGISLWNPTATEVNNVVDRVAFGVGKRGSSFTYNPLNGSFDYFSTNGIGDAFLAVAADDVGSPGVTTGPVPLTISQQPTNLAANQGDTTVFTVVGSGLPRAKYQWRFGGSPIVGATSSQLSLTNVQTNATGFYSVVLSNGVETLVSSNAQLIVLLAGVAPSITSAPTNRIIFTNQSATFSVSASGSPQPVYQWRFNGTNILDATNNQVTISTAQISDSGIYSVIASNSAGTNLAQATLTVTRRPNLRITEVMSSELTTPVTGHQDWWELSNLDDFEVDLLGYRFDDDSGLLSAAYTITNSVVIEPGESVVLVEATTPSAFRTWWGTNVGADVKIISYTIAQISFGSGGDAIHLWNPGATDNTDTLTKVIFSTATQGASFTYNPFTKIFGGLSGAGTNGAFAAIQNGDVGSPGVIRNPLISPIVAVGKSGNDFNFSWLTETNARYRLQFKNDLSQTNWINLTNFVADGSTAALTDIAPINAQRFYRVVTIP